MSQIKVTLPIKHLEIEAGTKRNIPVVIEGAKSKQQKELTWVVTNGIGMIDDMGLYQAPNDNDVCVPGIMVAEITATSVLDPSAKDSMFIRIKKAEEVKTAPHHTKKFSCIFTLLILSGVVRMYWEIASGAILISLGFASFALSFNELQDPFVGFAYRRGKLIGQLLPGWYLFPPLIWSIEKRTTAVIQIKIEEAMYTKKKTDISIKAMCFFHLIDPVKALLISDDDIKDKVKGLMMSETKTRIGANNFEELLAHKSSLENSIQEEINKKILQNGYTTTAFEITDLTENVESDAEKTKIQGRAQADVIAKKGAAQAKVMGQKAKEVSDNVGDSWKGVAGLFAQELGKPAVDGIINAVSKKKEEDKK